MSSISSDEVIACARSLRTDEDDSNLEYDRALVEMSSRLLDWPLSDLPELRRLILEA